MQSLILLYLSANLGTTLGYFHTVKRGWCNWQERVILAAWFLTIGAIWALLVAALKTYYERST